MSYRDYNFYVSLFRQWRRKHGGTIRSSSYETSRGYMKSSADPTSSTGAKKNSGIWHLEEVHSAISSYVPTGEHVYNTAGTYTWTCPADVTSISVVCVGGGGGGMYYNNSSASYTYPMNGGAGGGLGWKNTITVVPGQTYTVVVGAAGSAGIYSAGSTIGGTSYFINTGTVSATGGSPGRYNTASIPGGTYTGDGGGIGGDSGSTAGSSGPCGGGGAAGYAGNGGRGGHRSQTALSGTGGAGGGGGWSTSVYKSFGGGGVGLYGQASNGTAGAANTQAGGGSGGGTSSSAQHGGAYGGGGGGNSSVYSGTGGNGGAGAVRIVWGDTREFPSTSVDESSSDGNVTTN